MQGWIIRWVLNMAAIILTAALLSGFELTVWGAVVGSIFLGIINAIIRPILILLTLPLNLVTLGLFTFIVNALMLYITSVTIKGFDIQGFGWAILSAILISAISFLISFIVKDR